MALVIDSSALIAVLENETGASEVTRLLNAYSGDIWMHSVNVVELFYHVSRKTDVITARVTWDGFKQRRLVERTDMDIAFREDVAQRKADWRRVSLADCCGITLARRLGAEFVTADHHDQGALDAENITRFEFFR